MRHESLLQSIVDELTSHTCKQGYLEMKSKAELEPEDEAAIDQYFDFKVQSLVESCQDVCCDGDETELKRLLSHIWIEYRMEWIRYNTQMQYQNILHGKADPKLALRGASLSFLLAVVEQYLTTEEVYWCLKLAADPMNHLRSRTKLASRMVDSLLAGSGRELSKSVQPG